MPAQTVIRLRRGTSTQWTSTNPVLAAGELGIETNTRKFKFGNGTSNWNSLDYAVGSVATEGITIDWADVTSKPTEFNPSAHATTHGFGGADAITIEPSQVTGLNAFIGDVQETLPTKSDVGHTHTMSDITDLEFPPTTIMSDTAPLNPVLATRWIDTTTFNEYIYYDSAWVEV